MAFGQGEEMSVRTFERRRGSRDAAALPVAVLDRRGRLLLRARTSTISESGLYCVTLARRALRLRGEVVVEVYLPDDRSARQRPSQTRAVRYRARLIRAEELGQTVGLALEFIEKLG